MSADEMLSGEPTPRDPVRIVPGAVEHEGCAYSALLVVVDGKHSWFCNKCGRAGEYRDDAS